MLKLTCRNDKVFCHDELRLFGAQETGELIGAKIAQSRRNSLVERLHYFGIMMLAAKGPA
jgi:hypothetical protein